jgi:hypothetical protein
MCRTGECEKINEDDEPIQETSWAFLPEEEKEGVTNDFGDVVDHQGKGDETNNGNEEEE